MDRLHERVALVTGAASGIGEATAKRLANEGAAVLVTDIQDGAGTQVVKDISFLATIRAGAGSPFLRQCALRHRVPSWARAV